MVSNARLDLPDPESPVTTMRRSRGTSSEMSRRLCTRAPCTAMVVRTAFGAPWPSPFEEGEEDAAFFRFRFPAGLEVIGWFSRVEERQFLHVEVALLREAYRRAGLAEESLVRQVLTGGGHAAHVEVPLEMVLDVPARPRLADLAQVVEHQ